MTQEKSGPSAKIIADSISEWGHRLVTMEVRMHRFILAEMNTHRAFSRNSASSRAIPVSKIIDRVESDPAYPVLWGKEQKGMQTGDPFELKEVEDIVHIWDLTRKHCLTAAHLLKAVGLHKSLINRLLEPFMWHTAIITATEWDNFFHQRCSPDAQPEMKAVADQMQLAYYSSTPTQLGYGAWHLPYIRPEDPDDVRIYLGADGTASSPFQQTQTLKRISTARCARVSYLTQDGHRDISLDLDLYDRLYGSGHWSPFEHVATPVPDKNDPEWYNSNFIGWKQFRKEFGNENRTHFLPNLPELAQTRMRLEAGLPR